MARCLDGEGLTRSAGDRRRFPEQTVFTRSVPFKSAAEMPGAWRAYYEKWADMTREHMDPRLIELGPALAAFVPPARVFDKMTYSRWISGELHAILQSERIDNSRFRWRNRCLRPCSRIGRCRSWISGESCQGRGLQRGLRHARCDAGTSGRTVLGSRRRSRYPGIPCERLTGCGRTTLAVLAEWARCCPPAPSPASSRRPRFRPRSSPSRWRDPPARNPWPAVFREVDQFGILFGWRAAVTPGAAYSIIEGPLVP